MIELPIGAILNRAATEIGAFLPRLAGALILLVLGLIIAKLVGGIVRRGLQAGGADDLAERWDVHAHLRRAGLAGELSEVAGKVVRLGLSVVVIFAALSLLGLQFLSDSLNAGVLAIPKLLIAAVLLLAGVVLGSIARQRVDRLTFQLDLPVSLGQVAQVLVVAIFAITAASQIAVSTAILLVLVAILLAGGVGMLALAFGLGGQGVARELSANRHARAAFAGGEEITVAGIRGRVVEVETMATVLETPEGERVRVPNRLLVEEVVHVHGGGPAEGGEPPAQPAT